MRKAGIREARQHLSELLAEVALGREILITDRGRAVARLAPVIAENTGGVPDLAEFRSRMGQSEPSLAEYISQDRDDRF